MSFHVDSCYKEELLSCFIHKDSHNSTHTHIQHAQSPVGRRPRARPHIWQESNWACLMADIQERRRGKQTCSDEGEWRAISSETWFPLPLTVACCCSSILHFKWMLRQNIKSHDSSAFWALFCFFIPENNLYSLTFRFWLNNKHFLNQWTNPLQWCLCAFVP